MGPEAFDSHRCPGFVRSSYPHDTRATSILRPGAPGRSTLSRARLAWSLTLASREDEGGPAFEVVAIESAELPAAVTGLLPEHRRLRTVRVRVRDAATGGLVASRVHVRDAAGEYWPPRGHEKNIAVGWREDVGGDDGERREMIALFEKAKAFYAAYLDSP